MTWQKNTEGCLDKSQNKVAQSRIEPKGKQQEKNRRKDGMQEI